MNYQQCGEKILSAIQLFPKHTVSPSNQSGGDRIGLRGYVVLTASSHACGNGARLVSRSTLEYSRKPEMFKRSREVVAAAAGPAALRFPGGLRFRAALK